MDFLLAASIFNADFSDFEGTVAAVEDGGGGDHVLPGLDLVLLMSAQAGIPPIATNEHPYCFAPNRYKQRVEPSGNSRLHMYISEGLLPFPVQNDSNGFEIGWDRKCHTIDGKMGYKASDGLCDEMTTGRARYHKGSNGNHWLGAYVSGPGGIRAFPAPVITFPPGDARASPESDHAASQAIAPGPVLRPDRGCRG